MNYYGPCQAMLDAGITDPESYEGKHFCTEHCPYPVCVFDTKERVQRKKKSQKVNIARLHKKGRTVKEIAEILNLSLGTVYKYLK